MPHAPAETLVQEGLLVIGPLSREQRLLTAVRAGDRAAAEEMVEMTYSTIYAALYRLCGDQDLASDLTQDTYRKAWEAIRSFDGRSKLTTWLYRIAYTTFLNHIRRPDRIVALEEEKVQVRDPAELADEELSRKEESSSLREAVMGLPEDLRFTVTAHFWGDLPIPEIARIEGVTAVAIRKRLRKAFGILESDLGRALS